MAKLNIGMVRNVIMVIIILTMIFYVLGDTSGDVDSASGNVSQFNSTGDWLNATHRNVSGNVITGYEAYNVLPLVSFFKKKGVVLLAFIAGLVIIVISAVLPKGKK